MDPSYLLYAGLFLLFAFMSGFFSASETALFSLSPVEMAKLQEKNEKRSKTVVKLLADSRRLLITILIGNTLVNICAATIATLFVVRVSKEYSFNKTAALLLDVVGVTLFILIFSEILPKVLAVKHSRKISLAVSPIIELFYIALYPISTVLESMTKMFRSVFRIHSDELFFSEEEIKTLVEMGEEEGAIHSEEKEMIDSIFEFGDTAVREIMVPRIDMVCIEINSSVEDLVRLIREKGHSRIPVYEGRIDYIKGIVHAKDLLMILDKPRQLPSLKDLARPAYFVPESKKIDELLREFQQEKTHMAIVVDEYGGTEGLVTLEDIIEEIVGEIQDEYDREQPLFLPINENTFSVDGRISIEELNEILPEPLPTTEKEDYETLGGLIYHITGSVPHINDRIHFHNYDFIIEHVERQRIKKVKIIKVPEDGKDKNRG